MELLGVSRVVEQVRSDHEIELSVARQFSGVAHEILDPQSLLGLLLAGQFDHSLREIDAGHACRAPLPNHAGVETFAAGHIQHAQFMEITDQLH